MQLLTIFRGFQISRQKVLSKRRKVNLKNRPVSKKRLKEQQQIMNISYQTKLVEIKKQMDRKKSQNHHINQIIQELFYPQVKLQNEREVEIRAKQVSSQPYLREQFEEAMTGSDDLMQQIKMQGLPADLMAIHENKWQKFQVEHYQVLFSRIDYYCYHKQTIKKNMMNKWQKLVKQMREKQGKNIPIKCPYLFLQKQQIIRHQYWSSMIKQIHRKMKEIKNISQLNNYFPVLFQIIKTFSFLPAEIYYYMIERNALSNFQQLGHNTVSNLIKFLKFRNKLKFNPLIKIQTPNNDQQQLNISHFARKLSTQIINNPEKYTKDDFINIFIVVNASKKRMNILDQQLLSKSQNIITNILTSLSFENVYTYMTIYALFKKQPSIDFLEILKYDLYRKAQNQTNYFPLTMLIINIKDRNLKLRNIIAKGMAENYVSIQAYDLLVKCCHALSKHIFKLKSSLIISVLNSCLVNDLKNSPILQILATEFVKKGNEFNLEQLGQSAFKLTILGHRSKILSRYIFDEYKKRYHSQMKRYKEQDTFLFPTTQNAPQTGIIYNFKQIHLQQCLLMAIWTIINQLNDDLKRSINLEDLLTIIPIKLESMDPMMLQLAENINNSLGHFSFFPKIQYKFIPNSFPQGRLKEYYKRPFSKSPIEKIIWRQAQLSQKFIQNYNYQSKKYLPERWSKNSIYKIQDYIIFCLQKNKQGSVNTNYFNSNLSLPQDFIEERKKVIQQQANNITKTKTSFFTKTSEKNVTKRIYDLL